MSHRRNQPFPGLFALLTLVLLLASCATTRTLTVVAFSDYHSHAVPFHVDQPGTAAGIARAIGWIKPLAAKKNTLVLSGGDTMNHGAPAWSDKYRCIEWSWWNGIVDAMAWGNHDADYGPAEFARCAKTIDYPILSANVVGPDGKPLFLVHGKPYVVFTRAGLKIGVFAVAGSDFAAIVRPDHRPVTGAKFTSRIDAAREVVKALRDKEHVDAVILIGHESTEDDAALARAVPGIDLILGTHSHRLEPLHRIPGTSTWTISPGAYLEYVSRVSLRFRGHDLESVTGKPVPMTADIPEDPAIKARVAKLERELEDDPAYHQLFNTIGHLDRDLSVDGLLERNSPLGAFVMERVREAVGADVAMSTSSSFRQSLAEGPVRETDLRDAMPYDNAILRCTMRGQQLHALLEHVVSLRGTDSFMQISGATLEGGITVGGSPIDPAKNYAVATTDYVAKVTPAYRDFFAGIGCADTGRTVRNVTREALAWR